MIFSDDNRSTSSPLLLQNSNINSQPPPLKKRICVSEDSQSPNRIGTDAEYEQLSWDNFPIIIRKEEHPSRRGGMEFGTSTAPQESITASSSSGTKEDSSSMIQILSTKLELNLKRKEHPSDSALAPTTFGWGDFPLLVEAETSPSESSRINRIGPSPDASAVRTAGEYDVNSHTPFSWNSAQQEEPTTSTIVRNSSTSPDSVTSFGWTDFLVPLEEPPSTTRVKDEYKVVGHSIPRPVSTRPPTPQRAISFGQVRIRSHSITLGDHPLCQSYPLSLDWEYSADEVIVNIDLYEDTKRSCCWDRKPRRLSATERRSRLAACAGISLSEVDVMEKYRQYVLAADERAVLERQCIVDDEEDGETADAPSIPCSSLTRVPTVHGVLTGSRWDCGAKKDTCQPLSPPRSAPPAVPTTDGNLPVVVEHDDDSEDMENLLEMSMDIGHAAHPGLETQSRHTVGVDD